LPEQKTNVGGGHALIVASVVVPCFLFPHGGGLAVGNAVALPMSASKRYPMGELWRGLGLLGRGISGGTIINDDEHCPSKHVSYMTEYEKNSMVGDSYP
jgi:hypothetical protein